MLRLRSKKNISKVIKRSPSRLLVLFRFYSSSSTPHLTKCRRWSRKSKPTIRREKRKKQVWAEMRRLGAVEKGARTGELSLPKMLVDLHLSGCE